MLNLQRLSQKAKAAKAVAKAAPKANQGCKAKASKPAKAKQKPAKEQR